MNTGGRKTGKISFNLDDVQEINRSIVLNILRRSPVTSRIELAKKTGLKQSTITNIINEFIQTGIVKEVGMIDGQKGRRSIGIALNSEDYKAIAVKITRKYYELGLYDIAGADYAHYKQRISEDIPRDQIIDQMLGHICSIISENKGIVGVGVVVPGPFLINEGKIALMSRSKGWDQVDLRKKFHERIQLPVYFEHDANAAAIAEWWFGDYNMDQGVMVTLMAGQGIGCGIVVDGAVFGGAQGTAGEVGHISIDYKGLECECGNRGCLELYCSSLALIGTIKANLHKYPDSMLGKQPVSVEKIAEAIEQHDALAIACVEEIGEYLACGVVSIINAYNPDMIIIADDLCCGGSILLRKVRSIVKQRVLPGIYEKLLIEYSTLKDDNKLLGAITLVVNQIFTKPSHILQNKEN